jgi:hypothetical protein
VKKRQTIPDEIARVCRKEDGYGIIIEVRSKDRGRLGSLRKPAYAHLFDTNMNPLGKFVITLSTPQKPSDIIWYLTDSPPAGYAENLVKWANSSILEINNWIFAIRSWESCHYD